MLLIIGWSGCGRTCPGRRAFERLEGVELGSRRSLGCASSSSCLPTSTILPFSRTMIWSARRTVDSRCAMTNDVRLRISVCSASCTSSSDSASSDGGRFVEDQDRRVLQDRARDRQPLPLPARQRLPALADPGLVLVRQVGDELVRVRRARGRLDLFARDPVAAVGDIAGDRSRRRGPSPASRCRSCDRSDVSVTSRISTPSIRIAPPVTS